jgi:NAD+ kinase
MSYRRVLVLIKQTAFDAYTAQQRIAAAAGHTLSYEAVRMDRLRERHETHMMQVDRITEWLTARGVDLTSVMRDDATQDHVREADLVLALGGDGTTLIASHLLRDHRGPPLLGVNTDRASINDLATLYRSSEPVDMRRSTGHLCATTASGDMEKTLTEVLNGDVSPTELARIRCVVAGEELAPALNDVLIAHPSPGAVSRYSVHVGGAVPKYTDEYAAAEGRLNARLAMPKSDLEKLQNDPARTDWKKRGPPLWFHVRSSGLRTCTASGSTAAMRSAGGEPMHYLSRRMQFMDREPIYHDHAPPPSDGHGFYEDGKEMCLRWNSRVGTVYLDGAHVTHEVKMGDRVTLSTNAPPLRLFTSAWFRRNHADRWPTLRKPDSAGEDDWIIE